MCECGMGRGFSVTAKQSIISDGRVILRVSFPGRLYYNAVGLVSRIALFDLSAVCKF